MTEEAPDLLVSLIERTNYKWFVETGSGRGDTTARLAAVTPHVVTIERFEECYIDTVERIRTDGLGNVTPLFGDSPAMLSMALHLIDGPALFFLDAHWIEGPPQPPDACPVLEELAALLAPRWRPNRMEDIIVIDDARLFGVEDNWPTRADIIDTVIALHPEPNRVQLTDVGDTFVLAARGLVTAVGVV